MSKESHMSYSDLSHLARLTVLMIYFLAFKDHLWWILGFIKINFLKSWLYYDELYYILMNFLYYDELSYGLTTIVSVFCIHIRIIIKSNFGWHPSVISIFALGMWFSHSIDFASLFLGFFIMRKELTSSYPSS